jgi:hypothetical protein
MTRKTISRSVFVAIVVGTFGLGFFCGTLTQREADAQLKGVGESIMKQATGSGGILGTAAELATTITDMEQHVDGLEKNISTLKKVHSMLTGKE